MNHISEVQSWHEQKRLAECTELAANHFFLPQTLPNTVCGAFRICIQCEHGWAPLFGDVSLCDWPEAARGAQSGLMLESGSPDCLSWAPPSVLASQTWKGCCKHNFSKQSNCWKLELESSQVHVFQHLISGFVHVMYSCRGLFFSPANGDSAGVGEQAIEQYLT